MPLKLIAIAAASADTAWRHKLVLDRPNRIVAWRGDEVPGLPGAPIDLVLGAAAGIR